MKKSILMFLVMIVIFPLNASTGPYHFDPMANPHGVPSVSHIAQVLAASKLSVDQQNRLLQQLDIKSHDSQRSPKEMVDMATKELPAEVVSNELKAACRVHIVAQQMAQRNSAACLK